MSTSTSVVPCLVLTSQGNCQFNILASFSYFLLYMKVQYIYCTYIIMYFYMYVALVFHWRRDAYVLKYVCIRSWKPFLCHWDLHTHLYQWLLSVLSLFNVWSSCEGWWIWMSYSWDFTLIQITYIHTCVACYSHFMLCTVLITQSNHLWLQFLNGGREFRVNLHVVSVWDSTIPLL